MLVALRLVLFTVLQSWFAMAHALRYARLHSWFPSGKKALPFQWVISYLISKGRFLRLLCHMYTSVWRDENPLSYMFILVLNAWLVTIESFKYAKGRTWLI